MSILDNILKSLFPPRTTQATVEALHENDLLRHPIEYHSPCYTLAPYADPSIRACIREVKFHNNGRAAQLLGVLFARWIREHVDGPATIVPIPLSGPRERRRGYNQVARIARQTIQQVPDLTLDKNILARARETVPQTTLHREARQRNVKGAFRIRKIPDDPQNMHFIILDDVYTTGATMRAAYECMNSIQPARISCVAIAH